MTTLLVKLSITRKKWAVQSTMERRLSSAYEPNRYARFWSTTEELLLCVQIRILNVFNIWSINSFQLNFELMQIWYHPEYRRTEHMFRASVETVRDNSTFLSQHPEELLREGKFAKIPWMTGVNSAEGLVWMYRKLLCLNMLEYSIHLMRHLWQFLL